MAAAPTTDQSWTPRQQAVLAAALDLLVESGDALTMSAVARRASCSKESLYNWFTDRDGLLTAIVQWQAAKVRVPAIESAALDAAALQSGLAQVALALLATITSDVSVALNRLAITHAATGAGGLGATMLRHGPAAVRRRVMPLLDAGRREGVLAFDDTEAAYRHFFGLVVRDTQIRLLLGEVLRPTPSQLDAEAEAAATKFIALYRA